MTKIIDVIAVLLSLVCGVLLIAFAVCLWGADIANPVRPERPGRLERSDDEESER